MKKLVLALLLAANAAAAQPLPQAGPGPAGPAGVLFYGSAGLVGAMKCWVGSVTTTTGGLWTLSLASMAFANPPNIQAQAISPNNLLSGVLYATMTAPTATSVSGAVALAGVGGLGPAGAVVNIIACGT